MEDGILYESYKFPSVIAWYNDNLLFGQGAKELRYNMRYGINMWHSFKMGLGTDVGCKYPSSELNKDHKKYTILNPIDAAQLFFKYLKNQILKHVSSNGLPQNIEYAFSIPASFEGNQRRDLINCLEFNDINISKQCLIDEPNAAFISYVASIQNTDSFIAIPENTQLNVLVFDFGAGTCDVSILEVGSDLQGIYSKNIAISEFKKLGGDDIDKLIAIDILLPQLLEASGYTKDDFRVRELKSSIIPKLLPHAERLKIMFNEKIETMIDGVPLLDVLNGNSKVSIGMSIEIDTSKGWLKLGKPSMDINQIKVTYDNICAVDEKMPALRLDKGYEFISLFSPIKSALKKAHLKKEEIDYVLFVGGSAKSPLIRNAVESYFNDSEYLIPRDLQAHVSGGTAMHSLILNGLGKNLIKPITSETIFTIIQGIAGEELLPLLPAGTIIPSDTLKIENLHAQKDGQQKIEIPICVGSKNKILYVIKMSSQDATGFSVSEKITISITVNSDKVLHIKAISGERHIMVEPISPYANRELTAQERIVFRAEKNYNLACQKNKGEPTYDALRELYDTYVEVEYHFKAAETLELISELFPKKSNLNNIGLAYSNAGKDAKAMHYYEKSMQETPTATTAFNIAIKYRYKDKEKYKAYLDKAISLDDGHLHSKYCLGKLLKQEGEIEEGQKLLQSAFDGWNHKFSNNDMTEADYSWFGPCAKDMENYTLVEEIKAAKQKLDKGLLFDPENLTSLTDYTNDNRLN